MSGELEPLRRPKSSREIELLRSAALKRLDDPKEPLICAGDQQPAGRAGRRLISRATVKADAAFRLFDVKCATITWAVIDSGIDRDHPGLQRRDPQTGGSGSRVITLLRARASCASCSTPAYDGGRDGQSGAGGLPSTGRDCRRGGRGGLSRQGLSILQHRDARLVVDRAAAAPGRSREPPTDGHGTHVAGIIGADMREARRPRGRQSSKGLCPDIQADGFPDHRPTTLDETEFAVIGALQLVRYLNSHNQLYRRPRRQSQPLHPARGRELRLRADAGLRRMPSAWSAPESPSSPPPAMHGYHEYQTDEGHLPGLCARSASPIPAMPTR